MKKRKLKKEVKSIMIVSILLLLIVGLIALDRSYTKKNIEKCVNNGNEYSYCVDGLK